MTTRTSGPTAAIAWIRAGIQSQGIYTGYRQLIVRFAGEAETATLYNGSMLVRNMERALAQSAVHSASMSGHDPLGSAELLAEAFDGKRPGVPVVVDCDGQRPDSIEKLARSVAMIQVALSGTEAGSSTDPAMDTLRVTAEAGLEGSLVLVMSELTADVQVLRLIERAHKTAPGTKLVVHMATGPDARADARYAALMEKAAGIATDVRLLARLPVPLGLR